MIFLMSQNHSKHHPSMQGMSPYSEPKPTSRASTPPKLSLFSLPPNPPDPPGLLTPPLQTPASVPFHWEHAPGKPRTMSNLKPKSVRSLDLPPRMLTSTPSPTTVLDGPCDRTLSLTWSFRKLAGRSEAGVGVMESSTILTSSSPAAECSSWRWGGGSTARANEEEIHGDNQYNEGEKVNEIFKVDKAMKVKRKDSFFNTRSHLWARVQESMYGSLKQVAVPWRRSGRARHNNKSERSRQ